ncbi:Prenylcysteine lyase-domain-containing protein [Glomus cerebriforme]|uniref:Prenylcysteine lyase-domain-containing protein n=1 Tax=Glomus cerebriforme TaxID=658196 RepID=A0A397THP5_9GLOM|nr:Prenylcysteine lyase-domain-containing protein [Glomus cerebriforme]
MKYSGLLRWVFTFYLVFAFYISLTFTIQFAYFEVPQQSAGAGGSSAAYWVSEAFANSSVKINTTVYEQSSRIGGRTKIIKYERDGISIPIELGASIFVDVNYYIVENAKKFGLEFMKYGEEMENSKTGIWNGDEFVFEQSSNSYWDTARILWKYGWAPIKVQNLVKEIIGKFLEEYKYDKPFTSIDSEAERLQLDKEIKFTAQYYFSELEKINQLYLKHFVEPMTRVNYAQNLAELHAMGAFISLAPQGAKSIKGGNYQLFEKFIEHSGANLKLDTKIVKVTKLKSPGGINNMKYIVKTKDGSSEEYDAIILAAPIQFTGIEFENMDFKIKEIPYITLHVTLITGYVNPAYFGRAKIDDVPEQIVTTNSEKCEFLSFAGKLQLPNGETISKLFSHQELSDEMLDRLYTSRSWTFRKVWKSYPKLLPNQTFPPLEPDENFFYINSFEPYISTMETECVSSRNIVKLLAERWDGIYLQPIKAKL